MAKAPHKYVSQYTGDELAIRDPDIEYAAGLAEGFSVTEARSYITQVDDKPREQLAVTMDTPYYFNGSPVSAYAVVDVSSTNRDNDAAAIRSFDTVELWVNGRNVGDICASNGSAPYVDAPDGVKKQREALDRVGVFAQAASFHEHVMEYDEYKQVFEAYHNKSVDEKMYDKYLERSKSLLKDGMTYIGKVQTVQDIDDLTMTTPSAQEDMRIYTEERYREAMEELKDLDLPDPDSFDGP